MEHALAVLRTELGKLNEENLINDTMLRTFRQERVEPSQILYHKCREAKERMKEIMDAIYILEQEKKILKRSVSKNNF